MCILDQIYYSYALNGVVPDKKLYKIWVLTDPDASQENFPVIQGLWHF